jgi:hypothetical protein
VGLTLDDWVPTVAPATRTLSPASWMELPGLRLADVLERGEQDDDRIGRELVARYYVEFARRFVPMELRVHARVTSMHRVGRGGRGGWHLDLALRESWSNGTTSQRQISLGAAKGVLLATGMYDRSKRLLTGDTRPPPPRARAPVHPPPAPPRPLPCICSYGCRGRSWDHESPET